MRKFLLLLGCFAASPLVAEEAKLKGEAIKTTLAGALIAIDTPVGSTVSVRIGHDGMMTGEAGTALGAVLGAAKDRGRWWVAQDQVCFKWFRWFDAEERCATFTIEGTHLTWRKSDGDTGTGTIVEQAQPVSRPAAIVAEAPKKSELPAHKAEHKPTILAASELPEPKPKLSSSVTPQAKPLAAAAPVVKKTAPPHETVVAMSVPPPRPAVRPAVHHDKVAVASVKPQFFKPAKARAAKVEPIRVQAPTVERHPFRVAGVDPSDVLNIRTGPSSDYQSVGSIAPDSRGIAITGPCQNDWCPVKHRTLVGWVNRRYLAEETASNTATISEPNYWDPAP
ncbi:SH3 domain-containing protein [Hyphomicrobium sp.]|uniref:SH3 domain-containing protein n=1 Tax=Hyphomicrobium sp. TaxID=82 RepID=UPI0025BADD6E|nr:SH3 domain-containing protein [Hyphomicrobium sp.]